MFGVSVLLSIYLYLPTSNSLCFGFSPVSPQLLSNFMCSVLKPTEYTFCCPDVKVCLDHILEHGEFLLDHILEDNRLSSSSHQLPVIPSHGSDFMTPFPIHTQIFFSWKSCVSRVCNGWVMSSSACWLVVPFCINHCLYFKKKFFWWR